MSEPAPPPRDYTGHDLAADAQAVPARRKSLPVQVRFAAEAGVLSTLEGPVHYRAGDALVTGETGDQWPVQRHKFEQRYRPLRLRLDGSGGLYEHRAETLRARRMEEPFSVRVGAAGNLLSGGPGDWLVQYSNTSWGVIDSQIFAQTYVAEEAAG